MNRHVEYERGKGGGGGGFGSGSCNMMAHVPIRNSLYSLSLDDITMKASMITNLLLISSVRSPSEHEADNVEHKHRTDCC